MQWNSTLYNQKHDFVAKYGEGLLTFLPENPAQAILDLGCGTGTLTAQLAARGSRVVGVDSARTMVERAKAQYPELAFQVCDALSLPFEGEFDVVFSNAVFHWIADHDTLLENVRKALKPGGQLICEFGGAGNIAAVEQAFNRACEELELAVRAPVQFPHAGGVFDPAGAPRPRPGAGIRLRPAHPAEGRRAGAGQLDAAVLRRAAGGPAGTNGAGPAGPRRGAGPPEAVGRRPLDR